VAAAGGARGCACRHRSSNELAPAPRGQTCAPDEGCLDPRAASVLPRVLELSRGGERDAPTLASLALHGEPVEEEGGQVATVRVVGGPVVPRPAGGWSAAAAGAACADHLASSPALAACSAVPGLRTEDRLAACGRDVQVGPGRTAQLNWACTALHCTSALWSLHHFALS
jgi:hypothetical protein